MNDVEPRTSLKMSLAKYTRKHMKAKQNENDESFQKVFLKDFFSYAYRTTLKMIYHWEICLSYLKPVRRYKWILFSDSLAMAKQ